MTRLRLLATSRILAVPRLILMAAVHDAARAEWHARLNERKSPRAEGGNLTVKALGADTTELMLYDEIGYWGVTAKQFNGALSAVTTPKISLRINSPGGDVFDGYAMFNALKSHSAEAAVTIDGLAASAASVVALGGDTVAMADPSMMMIHRAWTVAMGNAGDMRATADVLAKVDGQIADVYSQKTGKSSKAMLELMDAETWLTAQEAADLGLVDQVIAPPADDDADDAAASAHAARMRGARLVALRVK